MTRLERLTVRNHRGSPVPAVLGFLLVAGGALAAAVGARVGPISAADAVTSGAALLVALVGFVDDLVPEGPRGLRGHVVALANGQVTTGAVKVVAIIAASLITVAASTRTAGISRISGVILIAGATNLWNGLDVRPGRALKWFLLLAAAGAVGWPHAPPFGIGVAIAALVALFPDLRERAMLGDAGANLLGFTAGVALYARSPSSWIPYAAAVMVVLNIVADTVSLSRVIEAVPPLRWFDRVGTLREDGVEKTGA